MMQKKNHLLLMRTSLITASILMHSSLPSTVEAWSTPSSKITPCRCTDEAKFSPFQSAAAARRPSSLLVNFGQSNRDCGVRFAAVTPEVTSHRQEQWSTIVQGLRSILIRGHERHRHGILRITMASMIVLLSLSTSAAPAAAAASTTPPVSMVRPLGTLRVVPTKAEIDICIRLIVASLGGAAVGLERSS